MSCHLDAEMYRTLMYDLGLGHALYEPGPSKYDHIRVGDVGYVYNGTFKRLFNACFEEDDQANQDSTLTQPYQPIEPRYRGVSGDRRLDAGIRKSHEVKVVDASASISAPTVVLPVNAGSAFSFRCDNSHGAMLVTTTSAVLYDADKKGAYEKYMKAQADALERLIEDEGLGIELHDIIIVTECCLTRDWAIMVVRDSSSSSSFGFEIAALDANIQGSVARLWSSQIQVPLHQWPPNPPLRISIIGKPESHNDEVYRDVEGTEDSPARTQCIFLRGYRVSRRRRWLGMKIRAAAEPQDLPEDHSPPPGPAVRADRNTPELVVLDESLNTTEKPTDIYQEIFNHIFQSSEDEIATLHDDVVCRIATDNWKLDNLMTYLEEHAVCSGGLDDVPDTPNWLGLGWERRYPASIASSDTLYEASEVNTMFDDELGLNDGAGGSAGLRKNNTPFVCPVEGCGMSFRRHFNLKGHLRSHIEERPYVCTWPNCGKSFARQHDCMRHEALHACMQGFHKCDGCGRTFARLDALNRHHRAAGGVECPPDSASGVGGNIGDSHTVDRLYHPKSNDGGTWLAGHYVA